MIDALLFQNRLHAVHIFKVNGFCLEQSLLQRYIFKCFYCKYKLSLSDGNLNILKLLLMTLIKRICNTKDGGKLRYAQIILPCKMIRKFLVRIQRQCIV